MTARAVATCPPPAPVRVPAVASTALRRMMSKSPLSAAVLGTSTHAVWLISGDEVAVVSTRDATRLPNGVELGLRSDDQPFASVAYGAIARIGATSIDVGSLAVEVVRWWDPRPVLAPVSMDALAAAVCRLPASVEGIDSAPLGAALANAASDEIVIAARSLLGRGPGLTPEGDDYLAGAFAATRVLGAAIGSYRATAALDRAAPRIDAEAARRTTTFSAALIRCALRGDVAAPAGTLLRSISGRGDVIAAHLTLAEVGHSSGPALAAGIVLGVQSLVHHHSTTTGGSS